MRYEYTYRNTPGDYWRFYMSNIYHQWTAVVNIVFTLAALVLIIARWRGAHPILQGLMALAFLLFPALQPLAVYLRSRRQAAAIREDTTLTIEDGGFGIRVRAHRQKILWKDFHGAMSRAGLIVLMPDEIHAYLLPDRVTGGDREKLVQDLKRVLPPEADHLKTT